MTDKNKLVSFDQPPAGFNLDVEAARADEAAQGGIYARESEPSDVDGPDPQFDGRAPDDDEVDHDVSDDQIETA